MMEQVSKTAENTCVNLKFFFMDNGLSSGKNKVARDDLWRPGVQNR
ncbi:hypothetical protein A11S_996 [Micavibrio aeruginosavorus EPB]|uniref:Uncharacterized protein n=1 Tax=Micavibrio aeruginosavorus EPB TaxID=349215 RepID=M4VIE4_9BACT|nr:hypothetical protein A11S_996 [Micavibrio aeruginosavorus EPB]